MTTSVVQNDNRIIVALDTGIQKASFLIDTLGLSVAFYKIGLQQICSDTHPFLIQKIHSIGNNVFMDGKFHDTANTVKVAAAGTSLSMIQMFSVHVSGGIAMMKTAKETAKDIGRATGFNAIVLGVTVLTSLNYDALAEIGLAPNITGSNQSEIEEEKIRFIERLVVNLALSAQKAGLDGVVTSPREANLVRKACGPNFLIVTPSIGDTNSPADDQKRRATAREAILAGADYLIIGRPICDSPDPLATVKKFNREVEEALTEMAQKQQTEGKEV